MRIDLTPENNKDREWLKERARTGHGGSASVSEHSYSNDVTEGAKRWASTQRPGPGSIVRCEGETTGFLRVVGSDGKLRNVDTGEVVNDADWSLNNYEIVYEHGS